MFAVLPHSPTTCHAANFNAVIYKGSLKTYCVVNGQLCVLCQQTQSVEELAFLRKWGIAILGLVLSVGEEDQNYTKETEMFT